MKRIAVIFMLLSAAVWGQYETQQDYQESADKVDKVYVECDMGKIYCEPSSDNNVSISVKKNIFIKDDEKAKRLADDIKVDFTVRNKTLRAIVDIPESIRNGKLSISKLFEDSRKGDTEILIRVLLPENIGTEIKTASADIYLTDLKGNNLDIKGSSSDISLENTKGNCGIDVSSGDFEGRDIQGDIDFSGSSADVNIDGLTGNLKIAVSSGDCYLERIIGDARIRSSSGDIKLINLTGNLYSTSNSGDFRGENITGSVDISTTSGAINLIHYAGDENNIYTDATSGDIHIEVPMSFKGKVELESVSGDISSGVDLMTRSKSSKHLAGTLAEGNGLIKAETTSGDIFLESY